MSQAYTHQFHWNRRIGGKDRKGMLCRIQFEVGGKARVEFEDGDLAVVSRQALRAAAKVAATRTTSP